MSLHLHNPYIVRMQGSLKTGPSMPSFPVLCGGKDGVCEPVQKPETDDRSKPEKPEPQQMPSKPPPPPQSMQEHGKEAVEPVKGDASKWEKQVDNDGNFCYWNSGTKKYTYTQPEGWSENKADKWEKQLDKSRKFFLCEPWPKKV